MREGFLTGLHRSWFAWSGWLFTVAGTVYALSVSGAYAWIGALIAAAGLVAITVYAYQLHTELRKAEDGHAGEITRLQTEVQTARERTEQAERKLNEVPLDILTQLQEMLEKYTFEEAVRLLAEQSEFVARMQQFQGAVGRPLNLRTFARQGGQLHAIAKGPPDALPYLRVGDRFRLLYRGVSGLETVSASLEVSQPPDLKQETVAFRFVRFFEEEMGHIDQLAKSRDVRSMAGYSVVPDCDPTQYSGLDLGRLREVIQRLALEIVQRRRT